MDMGPTTHFLAYFRLVLGATNTPPAPRFRPVLGLAAPAAPFGSFGTFRDLGSPEPQNMHVHVLGFLADRPPRQPTFRPRAPLGIARCLFPTHTKLAWRPTLRAAHPGDTTCHWATAAHEATQVTIPSTGGSITASVRSTRARRRLRLATRTAIPHPAPRIHVATSISPPYLGRMGR